MPLSIFDTTAGESREANQADLDELLVIRTSHGRIMSALSDERTRLLVELQAVRTKHAQAKETENDV